MHRVERLFALCLALSLHFLLPSASSSKELWGMRKFGMSMAAWLLAP
jgi:hypothetical protein